MLFAKKNLRKYLQHDKNAKRNVYILSISCLHIVYMMGVLIRFFRAMASVALLRGSAAKSTGKQSVYLSLWKSCLLRSTRTAYGIVPALYSFAVAACIHAVRGDKVHSRIYRIWMGRCNLHAVHGNIGEHSRRRMSRNPYGYKQSFCKLVLQLLPLRRKNILRGFVIHVMKILTMEQDSGIIYEEIRKELISYAKR